MIARVPLRALPWSAALAALPMLLGCRASPAYAGPTAECPVCRHEGDLACVCVRIEPDTPRCECAGETYYFCSDECRADFQAQPERYVPRRPR
jgi:hypothetical protein